MHCLTFTTPPKNFSPDVQVAGLFCEHLQTILFLKRHPQKSQGNTWGIPAGKMEQGEDPLKAVLREIHEEAGFTPQPQSVHLLGTLYKQLFASQEDVVTGKRGMCFTFHMFRTKLPALPKLCLSLEENTEAKWVTLQEAHQLPLIAGAEEVLEFYRCHA